MAERFPDAVAAWLGGSVAAGTHSATSDLDITVLLAGPPAPFRESLHCAGWPAELFVHTGSSLTHYRREDAARRQPTIMRLIADSVVLIDTDGSGGRLQRDCAEQVAAGPPPLGPDELASLRYAITDLLEDLRGSAEDAERAVVAMSLLEPTADLLLTGAGRWTGSGKGRLRELRAYDEARGTDVATALLDGVLAAARGDVELLVATCDAVLDPHGGRLFDGHRVAGSAGSS